MYSPRPPSSAHPTTSFASVTDSTLHRQGWQSPIARPDARRTPGRKIPPRFRTILRYDALSPSPTLIQREAASTSRTNSATALSATRSPVTPEPKEDKDNSDAVGDDGRELISTKEINLDELTWFQHRWLDKHGKDSHLKASREKMALLRRWFESLDADGSGEVGLDELVDPLVSVGLARSRDEVQQLIDQVDHDGSGEVTFAEFLRMMNPKKPTRARQRQPLHYAKPRTLESEAISRPSTTSSVRRPATSAGHATTSRTHSGTQRPSRSKTLPSSNAVVKLFEDMQSGKLGDLAIPFPVLITAYRRRMLLNAHMADDPTARRLGSSVLQALESTRQDNATHSSNSERRNSSVKASESRSASPSQLLPQLPTLY